MAENKTDAKASGAPEAQSASAGKTRVTIYVTKENRVNLRILAAKRDVKVSDLLETIIAEALARPEYKE